MMRIGDIFDALSASDVLTTLGPTDRAAGHSETLRAREEIDPELFRVFLDARFTGRREIPNLNYYCSLLVGAVLQNNQCARDGIL